MGVTVKVDMGDFKAQFIRNMDEAAIGVLSLVCQMAIDNILEIHDWKNITGNMHSSVGGVVAKKGKVMATFGFNAILDGAEGASKGKAFATELAQQNGSDYCCYVVVGVDYASDVEARGRDIISSTDLWVRGMADQISKDIINQMNSNVDK